MLGVDVGGTFTDVVGVEDGRIVVTKVPTDPSTTESSVLEGARALNVGGKTVFNHASTAGLNAIITRNIPKIGFITTEGHRDMLDAGRVWRPRDALTDADWRRSFGDATAPLVPRYLRRGVRERLHADGSVLIPLDESHAIDQIRLLKKCDVTAVAICLLHSYVNSDHETRVRDLVRQELGDIPCSTSFEVSPLAKEYARASTTVIDVLMKVVFEEYYARLASGLRELGFQGDINFADSAARLLPADVAMRRPHRIVFSGPAAGTIASRRFGNLIEEQNMICCDVGGTSCDISIVENGKLRLNTTFELEHDLVVNALATEITSFGAGGGSIVSVDAVGEIGVGPASAGAFPGPACYGRGGEAPTVTDACLLIGILDPDAFLGGDMRLDVDRARGAFEALDVTLDLPRRVAYAYRLALNNIAEGVVDVAIRNGIDPREYSLVAFGAAGPMLLPALLELTHVKQVLIPPYPGLFSALGLLSSELVYSDSRSAYVVLGADAAPQLDSLYASIEAELREHLPSSADARIRRTFDGRLVGQSWDTPFIGVAERPITAEVVNGMIRSFHDEYERRWGNRFERFPVQGVTYRVQLTMPTPHLDYEELGDRNTGEMAAPSAWTELRYLSTGQRAAVFLRPELRLGDVIMGPALIREDLSTTHVTDGQVAVVGRFGELAIRRHTGQSEEVPVR